MKNFFAIVVVLIGISLTNGNCYAISEEDFFSIALEKAENGDPEYQWCIGFMYDFGKGIKQDYKKAFEWYEKSANQGNSKA